ncbi:MAG: hypothetical protein NVS1B10_06610 [Candidatus Saccharimonadales bacterium]
MITIDDLEVDCAYNDFTGSVAIDDDVFPVAGEFTVVWLRDVASVYIDSISIYIYGAWRPAKKGLLDFETLKADIAATDLMAWKDSIY